MRRALCLLAAALALGACHDPVDEAAKARIFSPEDPPRFVTRAADDLTPGALQNDPEHLRRIFKMSALEAGERLGPHKVESTLTFTWSLGRKKIALDEEHTVTVGSHGDFAARLDDGDKLGDSRQGMEMIRAQGRVFARSRFQKFRERNRDRGAATRYEDRVYGVLATVYDVFGGRIAVSPDGEGSVAGRKTYRYQLALASAPAVETDAPDLPKIVPPRDGFNPQLQHEMDLDDKKVARSLSGTLDVDAQTGVALQTDLHGTLDAPGEEGKLSTLEIELSQKVLAVSDDIVVAPPVETLPAVGRPLSIASALERFDLPRSTDRADGGSSDADDADDGE